MKPENISLEQLGFSRIGNNHGVTAQNPTCIFFKYCTLALDRRGKWLQNGRHPVPGFRPIEAGSFEYKLRCLVASVRKYLLGFLKSAK